MLFAALKKTETEKLNTVKENLQPFCYIRQVKTDLIEHIITAPPQPKDNIVTLAENIRRAGLLSPISVYTDGQKYLLIDGARRLEAYKLLERDVIPCHLYTSTATCRSMLIANTFTVKPCARSVFARLSLLKYLTEKGGYSEFEVAESAGVSRAYISKIASLRVFSDEEIRRLNIICPEESRIFEIAALKNPELREKVIDRMYKISGGSLRETIQSVREEKPPQNFSGDKLFDNSVAKLVSRINGAGKQAEMEKSDLGDSISYTIRISK